jgi:O-acetyl-ADP-ribose deacetylase (regulator of RNase III)
VGTTRRFESMEALLSAQSQGVSFGCDIPHAVSRGGGGGGVDRADQRAVKLYEAVTAALSSTGRG